MYRTLQVKHLLLSLITLLLLSTNNVSASHTMGADLTYQCLGGNTFKITVSFYRDCIGIAAPTSPYVTITSATCSKNIGVTCYPRPGTGQEVTPACSSSVTTCNGGSFTGIQEWVYDGIITLPAQCSDWVFGYSLCCRNAAITTINSPSGNTFYIYATLNNLISTCNSSPTFSNKPVPFLCKGQQYCFNHGAFDQDGDSLVYSLITPYQTATTQVTYHAPYNASNPLNSAPSTSFNSATGDICLNPQALEVTVMAVLVSEYRNGQLIGTVERDLQLTVMNCANNLPSLSGINGTNNFSLTVCANQQTCFDIFSSDPDVGQQLTLNWNQSIPGATFTSGSGTRPTGTFCWTPTSANIGNSYSFTVRVQDDACPYYGSQIYSYTINVIGITVDAGPDQAIACSDLATLTAHGYGGSGTYSYLWSNGSTMQSITVGEGTYTVTANDGSCSATDTVKVLLPFIPTAEFSSSPVLCLNDPIQFTDLSTTPGGMITDYFWDFGDGSNSSQQNPSHQYLSSGTFQISLIIQNNLGCIDTVVHSITINPKPIPAFSANNTCVNSVVNFYDQTTGSANYWHWNFGDGSTSFSQNPTHTYTTFGNYNVNFISGDSLGCIDTISQPITIYPLPIANAGTDQNVCDGTPLTLTASGGVSYIWYPSNSTGSTFTTTPTGSTTISVTVTDANGCSAIDTVNVSIKPLPAIRAGADKFICAGSSVTLNASGGVSYIWMPGNYINPNYTVNPSVNTTYIVSGTGSNGCVNSDTVNVSVGSLPTASAGPDVNICEGQSANLTASGGLTYSWIPIGNTTANVTVSPTDTTQYQVIVSDAAGCTSNAYVNVNVNPLPVVNLQSFFLCAGSTTTLNAGNPGSSYTWNTGATSQSIDVDSGGNFNVTVTSTYGCQASSACTISYGNALTINLANVEFCAGSSATLDAGYPGMTYAWTPGGQTTQSINVSTPGNYGVTVTDSRGCSGSINVSAIRNQLPTANFSATSVCLGNTTTFSDGSSANSGSITNWNWNFSDGSSSTAQNPTHIFATSGNYNVQLTVTTSNGCVNSISQNVTVNPLPFVAFTTTNGCAESLISFTNQSTVSVGFINSYLWNFDDGSTSTQQNPTHQFSASGNYNVSLVVTTAGGCSASTTNTSTVFPLPVANFTASPVCFGNSINFANVSSISTGNISSQIWDFNDSYTSTQNSPSHNYSSPGNYPVSLIVTSNKGCKDTVIQNATVYALPIANAGSDQTICLGGTVTLTATGGSSYTWNPGNTTTNSIVVSPTLTSTYSVTVTNTVGCTSTDNVTINVNPLPLANAGTNKTICTGNSLTLNGSGGAIYNWTPGSLTTSSITVQPTTTTTYILDVTDINGCQNQASVNVSVNALPTINAGPDQTICLGSTISLAVTGGNSYQWNPIGSTSSTVLITPSSNATYTVIGTDVNGCISNDTMQVFVNPVPSVTLNPTFICIGSTTTLSAGNPGCTYNWSTGETTQSITISDSGNVSVVVTNPNGCSTLGQTHVTTGGNITANPTTVNICAGQSTTLNAGNPGATYAWSDGESTQIISTSTAGNYYVTITDANGCAATMLNIVNVNPLPTIFFATNPTCYGDSMRFTNSTSVSAGTINSNLWSFGDSYSSASSNPVHLYSTSGNYNVTLTSTTSEGCSVSVSNMVSVNPLPTANFSTTTVCLSNANQFTDQSSVSGGNISNWIWNFGDGSQGNGASTSHTYATPGQFTTSLIVTTNNNCTDTISQNVIVNGLPLANFTANNGCAESDFTFTNNSTSTFGNVAIYDWSFGNGDSSTNENNIINYANSGTYTATLTVTSSLGCSDSVSHNIQVYPKPISSFTVMNACMNTPITIANASTISSGSIQNYYWNFGDQSTSSLVQPVHPYVNSGNYQVSLVITSDNGCRDTSNQFVSSYELPSVSFSTENVCLGNDVDFINNSSSTNGINWDWNFGDGTNGNDIQPSHSFATSGNFNVQLTGTNSNGCTSTTSNSLNIYPNPVASFGVSNICLGGANQFVNQSSVDGGISFTSLWTMSDGTTSTQTNPAHSFDTPGIYNTQLSVTSLNGCTTQINHDVQVYNPPVARFAGDDVCDGVSTQFTNQSFSQDGIIIGWLWNFGDNSSSVEESPAHNYSTPNNYNVSLTTTSVYGCYDSYNDTVTVFERPSAAITATNACEGDSIQFANASVGGGSISYSWDLGNGFTSSQPNFAYIFPSAGIYEVTLVAMDQNNCSSTELARVEVFPKPSPDFSVNEVCLNSSTSFTNQSFVPTGNSITNYSWSFGDQSSSSVTSPTHVYSQTGNYNVSLLATTDKGCVQAKTLTTRVNPNPVALFSAGGQGCGPITSTFTGSSSISEGSITGWLWNFGDGEISTEPSSTHTFTASGNYDVNLTVVSDKGCYASYTGQNTIQVYPGPTANFSTDVVVTDIMNPTVHFQNLSSNYSSYQWIFGDGTSTSSVISPAHTFSDTGSYSALLITTNNYGCRDTISKSIEVKPKSTLFVPNAFTPNGDGKNDDFRPFYTNMKNLQVWVFDRWGLLLKTWDSLDGSWDGYYEGRKCQEDTYVYKIVGNGIDGQHSEWVGHVSIIY